MAWAKLALLTATDHKNALSKLANVFGYSRLLADDVQIKIQDGQARTKNRC